MCCNPFLSCCTQNFIFSNTCFKGNPGDMSFQFSLTRIPRKHVNKCQDILDGEI